jgi:hypothetical protein
MKTQSKLLVILACFSLASCGSSKELAINLPSRTPDKSERILCPGASSENSDGYGGGTGTKENTYLICTVDHFKTIQGDMGSKRFFKLVADLDFSNEGNLKIIAVSPLASIDGNNHRLKNITIKHGNGFRSNGLFGQLVRDINGNQDEIKNLIIENVTLLGDGKDDGAGVIAAANWGGLISNVHVFGSVSIELPGTQPTAWYVGGLVGRNSSIIENSSFDGSVSGADKVGGIAGLNNGTIRNSKSSGTIRGHRGVGGVVGVQLKSGQMIGNSSSSTVAATAAFGTLAGQVCDSDDYDKCVASE